MDLLPPTKASGLRSDHVILSTCTGGTLNLFKDGDAAEDKDQDENGDEGEEEGDRAD